MSAVVVEPWARETAPPFERLMRLAGARPDTVVCAAGPGNVELMIKLCREGYSRVECLREATCTCADEGTDVLIIPGATGSESLVSVLLRTASVVREGGVVALRLDDIDDDCAVQTALRSLGLEVASTVFDLSNEVLVAHRIGRASLRAIAS